MRCFPELEAAKRRIDAGEPFEKVAKEVSRNARTAALGGELPRFSLANTGIPDTFKQVSFMLKEGEVSNIVQSEGAYHLIKLEQKFPPRAVKYETVRDGLKEIAYGEWEGSTLAEMQAEDPELFARRQLQKWTVAPPGGESYISVQKRMQRWYDQLPENTVAVAHGGTARALMVVLGIETPESAADLTIEQGAVYVFAEGGLNRYG